MPLLGPVGLALLATTLACGRPAGPAALPVPGVVVLCIDTLRADAHLPSEAGVSRIPSLERFAREGVTFAQATAPAPWTSPSVTSLLTGLLPHRVGVSVAFAETTPTHLAPGVGTLALALQERGWSTAACTAGGWVTPENGLSLGFDTFTTNFDLHEPSFYVDLWARDRPKDRPFFLFLHTWAAHDPYGDKDPAARCGPDPEVRALGGRLAAALDAPGGVGDALYAEWYGRRWGDPCAGRALDLALGPERVHRLLLRVPQWQREAWRRVPEAGLPARLRTAYEAGHAFVERRVGATLRALDEAGLPEGTVVVVLGDHGEAFGEDGHLLHGQSLHDAALRVPLLVRAPGRLPAGGVVSDACSLVDVMPTILDLAGVPSRPDLDGRSLLPLVEGRDANREALAEGYMGATATHGPLGLVSVRRPHAKWVLSYDLRSGDVVRDEVYDLLDDPGERSPAPGSEVLRFGREFCETVSRRRTEIAARYGRPADPPACP